MVRVFGRLPKPSRIRHERARPWLERLEARDCPAWAILPDPTSPVVMSFSAAVLPGHLVQLSGQVGEGAPCSLGVYFEGAVNGYTSSDDSGYFSYTASDAVLGRVTATAVDAGGYESTPRPTFVRLPPPSVSLSLAYGSQRTVTLSGQVKDLDSGALTVAFSGVVSGSVPTNADGTFSLTTQASALGNVQASTIDLWGQSSSMAEVTVSSYAPTINTFTGSMGAGNTWVFSGTVNDESAAGLTVHLSSNLAGLNGQTATVSQNGTFQLVVQLAPFSAGAYANAQTTDWWGLNSNVATDWL